MEQCWILSKNGCWPLALKCLLSFLNIGTKTWIYHEITKIVLHWHKGTALQLCTSFRTIKFCQKRPCSFWLKCFWMILAFTGKSALWALKGLEVTSVNYFYHFSVKNHQKQNRVDFMKCCVNNFLQKYAGYNFCLLLVFCGF